MNFQYNILSEVLRPAADRTITYFIQNRGVPKSGVKVEEPIDCGASLPFRPTFSAETSDHYLLCVDVGISAYNNTLNDFIVDCIAKGVPAKLFIAIPSGTKDPDYPQKLNLAKERGVGILDVGTRVTVIQEALPLSLVGVRAIPLMEFPARLRENLTKSETVFRNGSPEKACGLIFDEVESLCRAVAKKTYAAGHWTATTSFDFENGAWARLMHLLSTQLDLARINCPKLSKALLARIHGATTHRNQSGHKPSNGAALIRRDRELRTRFESAVDLLNDLVVAVKPLRVT